jgi:hypothetical protein
MPAGDPVVELTRRLIAVDHGLQSQINSLGQSIQTLGPLLNPPRAQVAVASSGFSIPNNAQTAVTFDTIDVNTNAMYTSGTRVTAVTTGKYRISAALGFAANATGRRQASVRLNGATSLQLSEVANPGALVASCPIATFEYPLAIGDYLELLAFQTSGGALLTSVANPIQTFLRVEWCGI